MNTPSPPPAEAMPPAMIALHGLCLHYTLGVSRIDVLRNVELQIPAGQSVAVAGPSGSGKSSLLLLLAGLERPGAGRVVVAGTDLAALDRDALADLRRDHVGIVFQSFHLLPSLSALDNVALPLQIAGAADALPRARALLQRVGLDARLGHYPSQLSGGEQQRVAIARALVHDPRLIVCDEPTSSLDHETGRQVMEILRDLAADGQRALVVVSHDPRIYGFADRIARMDDGRITGFEGPAAGPAAGPGANQ
jgi:putative ABC transport system ATP-binding protein